MTDDGFILIVSDRPTAMQGLARNIAMVLPCQVVTPNGALPSGNVVAVVSDIASTTALPAHGPLGLALAAGAPLLYLAREQGAADDWRAQTLGASTVVAASMSRTTILAILLKICDAGPRSPARPSRFRTGARAAEAGRILMGFFEAAGADAPLAVADVDEGTEIVIEAIDDSGIRAWLEVIWAHDDHLYQHALSVTGYAAAFAGALGFSMADRRRLAKAALLHDVGKTKIPTTILNKPARLDDAETAIMREHPAIGEALLAAQPGFDPEMLDVVRHHHEMLDGSGYPDGLAGRDIADLVRLVTICDIYSALTERRTYREAMPGREAYDLMRAMQGKLDMTLLHAFRPVSADAARVPA